jgi:hypothetical protein
MAVYKDPRQPIELRLDAAKTAIPYEKPRLAAIEGKVESVLTLEQIARASMEPRERVVAASNHCAPRAIG